MKKTLIIALAAVFVIFSCQKPNEEDDKPDGGNTEIELEITGNLEVTSLAGTASIPYSIINPVENGKIYAESAEGWISGFDYGTPGEITFYYEANEGDTRNSIVTISYTEGDILYDEKQINVIQDAPVFEITVSDVQPTSARIISKCTSNITWTSDTVSKKHLESVIGGKENMPEYFSLLMKEAMWFQYGYDNFESFIVNYLFQGNTTDDWIFIGLSQETQYLTWAVGMDYEGNYTTEFYWGPEFTTGKVEIDEKLTFDIDVEPKAVTAELTITPSDMSVYYIATVIDNSWYDEGYTDENIMQLLCDNYGSYITNYVYSGKVENLTVANMKPSTEYYAIAFAVDINACTFSSPMTKVTFTTLDSGPYASAEMNYWWHIDDLTAYNPVYDNYRNPNRPLLVAIDFEFNDEAESAYWIIWYGNVTTEKYEDVYQMTLNAGPAIQYKDDPAPINYMAYNEPSTLCVIARDADENLEDMYMQLITLTEDGKSTDFGLFDQYFNDLMGGAGVPGNMVKSPWAYSMETAGINAIGVGDIRQLKDRRR